MTTWVIRRAPPSTRRPMSWLWLSQWPSGRHHHIMFSLMDAFDSKLSMQLAMEHLGISASGLEPQLSRGVQAETLAL